MRSFSPPLARLPEPAPRVDPAGLRPYQVVGAQWLSTRKNALLSDDPRVGKTAQLLRALPPGASAIVVCPAVARLVWREEIRKWRPELTAVVSTPLYPPRRGEVAIVSYDGLVEAVDRQRICHQPLAHAQVIADEIHWCKSGGAQRTQAVRKLARRCRGIWGASGTPLVGTPEDLWGVLVTLGLHEEVFPLDMESTREWFDSHHAAFLAAFNARRMWIRRNGELVQLNRWKYGEPAEWVREHLSRVMLRRTRADVAPHLPPKQYVTLPVPAPDDLREHLDELARRWEDPDELPPFEAMAGARAALARSRIRAALQQARIMAEAGPLVVFSAHVEPLTAFRLFPRAGVIVGATPDEERDALIRKFQRSQLALLAVSIGAGGVAIDLSRASQALFVDLSWTPGDNAQAEDRLISMTKREPVQVTRMVSDHPLDLHVLGVLARKQELIGKVVG